MDKIIKAVIFGGSARVSVIETTRAVNEEISIHNLTPLAAAVLGRSLSAGAYISANLKGAGERFNIIIDGGGPIGKICVAGKGGGIIKGFVENPSVDLPYKNGKLDVGGAVGKDGFFRVVKDLGLKEPYNGSAPLVSGEIASDYAEYLLKSEGITAAVALGVLVSADGCVASGGIIAEALPGATDAQIFMLEDIMSNFGAISSLLAEKSAEEIMDFYFGHLDATVFPPEPITLKCDCAEKITDVVRGIGREEAEDIIRERGEVELVCDYCNSAYKYIDSDLDSVFGKK